MNKKEKASKLPKFEVDLDLDGLQKAAQDLLNNPEELARVTAEANEYVKKHFPQLFKEEEADPPGLFQPKCDHGVSFDEEEFNKNPSMSAAEVQKRWPRGWGPCPKGCGYAGIAYASYLHYIAGDW